MNLPRISSVYPLRAIEGGCITVEGEQLVSENSAMSPLPAVTIGAIPARIVFASQNILRVVVPSGLEGGRTAIRVGDGVGETAYVEIGCTVATGLHQVDSPAFDDRGNLYGTYSGTRGERSAVSVFRILSNGYRQPFVTGITNATSMAFSPEGQLYVSSRLEGCVYSVSSDGSFEVFVSELGVACGIAFSDDGTMYVGDRSGTIFRVSSSGDATVFATLPASIAAFHLAFGGDGHLFASVPTLSSCDCVFRIDQAGVVDSLKSNFGRPQGLAFDRHGVLHVVEALAGNSGVYQLDLDGHRTRILAGPNLVGVAFNRKGDLAVASSEAIFRFAST